MEFCERPDDWITGRDECEKIFANIWFITFFNKSNWKIPRFKQSVVQFAALKWAEMNCHLHVYCLSASFACKFQATRLFAGSKGLTVHSRAECSRELLLIIEQMINISRSRRLVGNGVPVNPVIASCQETVQLRGLNYEPTNLLWKKDVPVFQIYLLFKLNFYSTSVPQRLEIRFNKNICPVHKCDMMRHLLLCDMTRVRPRNLERKSQMQTLNRCSDLSFTQWLDWRPHSIKVTWFGIYRVLFILDSSVRNEIKCYYSSDSCLIRNGLIFQYKSRYRSQQ